MFICRSHSYSPKVTGSCQIINSWCLIGVLACCFPIRLVDCNCIDSYCYHWREVVMCFSNHGHTFVTNTKRWASLSVRGDVKIQFLWPQVSLRSHRKQLHSLRLLQKFHRTVWVVYIAQYSNLTPLTDGSNGFLWHATETTETAHQHLPEAICGSQLWILMSLLTGHGLNYPLLWSEPRCTTDCEGMGVLLCSIAVTILPSCQDIKTIVF